MDLKKRYYQLKKEEFDSLYLTMKSSVDSIHLLSSFGKDYFYCPEPSILNSIIKLHDLEHRFDNLFYSFSPFGQNQLIQSFLIDEIEATNQIEGILSTRHDIFYVMKTALSAKDKRIESIVHSYQMLLNQEGMSPSSLSDIRKIYDALFGDPLKEEEKPDGTYFRKGEVSITDGVQSVHQGFYPEAKIDQAMEEYLFKFNDENIEIYQRLILTHFMIETIHPYYDGNGRLGRFLMSLKLYEETQSPFAFLLSQAIHKGKSRYYKAFKEAREFQQFGNLNAYMDEMIALFLNGLQEGIKALEDKKKAILSLAMQKKRTKSEALLYSLLAESSLLSYFGLSNDELVSYSHLSKRKVIDCLNHFKKENLLKETKIGKYRFRKIKR